MGKSCVEFPMEGDEALFEANDAVGSGRLSINIRHGYPCPVLISFKRGKKKFSFAMDKSSARRVILYLLAEGI